VAGRTFLDTNLLLYLFDVGEPEKSGAARRVYDGMAPGDIVLSTQVLEEFFWNATRKLDPGLPADEAARHVRDFTVHRVVVLDVPMIHAAMARTASDSIAFWDALIVEAALSAECERLLTEDLQDGREFDGLRVENPFRESGSR
jgi:predicted nucleic acid-binding protein